MTISTLDALMNAVLLQLELASHTSAANTDGNVSHGKSEGNRPPRVFAGFLPLRRAYSACRTDEARRKVIREGLNELRSIRYSRKAGHTDTREGRRLIGLDERPVETVAWVYGYSVDHVYRLRREARKAA